MAECHGGHLGKLTLQKKINLDGYFTNIILFPRKILIPYHKVNFDKNEKSNCEILGNKHLGRQCFQHDTIVVNNIHFLNFNVTHIST